MGTAINATNGQWIDNLSTIGAGSDSFHEYLFKAYVLFGQAEYLKM